MFEADSLRQALTTLGTLLADRNLRYELVACGGDGLLLLGIIRRPTKDLDALALVEGDEYRIARPLPAPLVEAIDDTARALGLASDWLNPGPTDQLRFGLPDGFRERTSRHVFGGLTLFLAGRFDQVCFKLYAAADNAPNSKHVTDLLDLDPSDNELDEASSWVKHQDTSTDFATFVDAVIAHLGASRAGR
jgi:hypothetical protein